MNGKRGKAVETAEGRLDGRTTDIVEREIHHVYIIPVVYVPSIYVRLAQSTLLAIFHPPRLSSALPNLPPRVG